MKHGGSEQIQYETIKVDAWLSHWILTLMSVENQT